MNKPIKLTVTMKGAHKVDMFFETVAQVVAFEDFVKELIGAVQEKTRLECKG